MLSDLLDRFLSRDALFFDDDTFTEIAEAVPILAHFVATLQVKWPQLQKEYTELKGVKRPPAKSTLLEIDEIQPQLQLIKALQERGLIYGGLSGQMSGSIVALMLQDHGYIRRNASELTGAEGGPVTVQIIDDIK